MKVAEVLWGDAWIDTGDISVKKARKAKPIMRTTIGWLVAENEHGLVLCTDKYEKEKGVVNAPMFIPWGWIEEYWVYEDS